MRVCRENYALVSTPAAERGAPRILSFSQNSMSLTTTDHSRDSAGLQYVYPVISRRAGGLSIGINLNPNNACNWQCVYCQVPDLVRGNAPPVNLRRLHEELSGFISDVLGSDFFDRHGVEPEFRKICDIAISGNGEPTSSEEFESVIATLAEVMAESGLDRNIRPLLITNGSLMHQPRVQRGITRLAELQGDVWFKLDSATAEGMARINRGGTSLQRATQNLLTAASLCPTWIQTSVFCTDGEPMSDTERTCYLQLLESVAARAEKLNGVLLYGLARPSMQPEAERLGAVSEAWMQDLAGRVRELGLEARVSF